MSRRRGNENPWGDRPGDSEYDPSAEHDHGAHDGYRAEPPDSYRPNPAGSSDSGHPDFYDPDPYGSGPYSSGPYGSGSSGSGPYGQGAYGAGGRGAYGAGRREAYGADLAGSSSRKGPLGSYGTQDFGSYGTGHPGAYRPKSSSPGGPDAPRGHGGDGRRKAPPRRAAGSLIGPLAGAMGLAILLGAGVFALASSASSCAGQSAISLNVTAAPDIAPAIREIARGFNAGRHEIDGQCVRANVTATDPWKTATTLSGTGAKTAARPDVWIPDSSLWTTLVRSSDGGADAVRATPTSVARSPIIAALPRSQAVKLQRSGTRPAWNTLLKATGVLAENTLTKNDALPVKAIRLRMLDPARNASGLGAMVMTRMLLHNDPRATAIFTAVARDVQSNISPDIKTLFVAYERDTRTRTPVIISSEQSVWKYDQSEPRAPAVPIYPTEGVLNLDYPFVLSTKNAARLRAAKLLEQSMTTAAARAAVHQFGFRTPDGKTTIAVAGAGGAAAPTPRALASPTSEEVVRTLEHWTKLTLGIRILSLHDISGTMAAAVPGTDVTRFQATAQAAQQGMALLPDDTEVGIWTFSTNLDGDKDYREEVSIGPLETRIGSGTRRELILATLSRVRPKLTGDTGLYDSLLAAFREMKRTYKPDKFNTVLVLTDGVGNDDPDGISLGTLLETLEEEYDSSRPVQVISIGLGTEIDRVAMAKIAKVTNGKAYFARRPEQIGQILVQALSRRLCAPQCPER